MGDIRNAYKMLVGRPEWKGPRGSQECKWEDNIRIDLRETGGSCGLDSSGWGTEHPQPLWTRKWNLGFRKRRGISWLAQWLLASE